MGVHDYVLCRIYMRENIRCHLRASTAVAPASRLELISAGYVVRLATAAKTSGTSDQQGGVIANNVTAKDAVEQLRALHERFATADNILCVVPVIVVQIALGKEYAGMWSSDDKLAQDLTDVSPTFSEDASQCRFFIVQHLRVPI